MMKTTFCRTDNSSVSSKIHMIAVSSWKIGESHPGLGYSVYLKYQAVISKYILQEISTSEILQKGMNCTPSVVQLHISKLYSSQLPEGFAGTHLLSSCTLPSKLCPGSKTSHLRLDFKVLWNPQASPTCFENCYTSPEPEASLSMQVWSQLV